MEKPTPTPTSIDNVKPQVLQITYTSRFPSFSTFCKYLLPSIFFFITCLISMHTLVSSCLIKNYDPTHMKRLISYICFMFSLFACGYYSENFIRRSFRIPNYLNTSLNPNEI
ncbi:hypothetical protein M9Y10_029441 [Tritrichomonas musculus]|uniref:Uncharacterized protein n=1 Tax=Tritrichomonas musculus TaxID=1915356 RepID=A0ABR2KN25_9EUKA